MDGLDQFLLVFFPPVDWGLEGGLGAGLGRYGQDVRVEGQGWNDRSEYRFHSFKSRGVRGENGLQT